MGSFKVLRSHRFYDLYVLVNHTLRKDGLRSIANEPYDPAEKECMVRRVWKAQKDTVYVKDYKLQKRRLTIAMPNSLFVDENV